MQARADVRPLAEADAALAATREGRARYWMVLARGAVDGGLIDFKVE